MPRNAVATREKLLKTAFTQFYHHGFQGTGMDAILKEAGFSKGAVYNHFPTKLDLGYAVVEELISPWVLNYWRGCFAENNNPLDALYVGIEQLMKTPPKNFYTYGCPLNNLIQEMSELDDGFRIRLSVVVDKWIDIISTGLQRGIADGMVRQNVDANEVATLIVASLEGAIGMSKSKQHPAILVTVAKQLLAMLETLRPAKKGK